MSEPDPIDAQRPHNVAILGPQGYVHSLALLEIGKLLVFSFESLGVSADLSLNKLRTDAVNVILGYHVLDDPTSALIGECIVYQLEQLSDREGWFRPAHLELFRGAREVWDYSPENVAFLESMGLENVKLLPIGYHERLRTIPRRRQDVDVLFYGSVNARRRAVLDALKEKCDVKTLFGVYGDERDAWIGRSKIALNIHFYEAQVMEQARISYLLNNRCFVVSEESKVHPYEGGIVTASIDELADVCLRYLNDPQGRYRIAKTGHDLFRKRPMTEYLKMVR